jgi:hypothetical protein
VLERPRIKAARLKLDIDRSAATDLGAFGAERA